MQQTFSIILHILALTAIIVNAYKFYKTEKVSFIWFTFLSALAAYEVCLEFINTIHKL